MMLAFSVLVFLLGIGCGSFVNVLVDRRERHEKILGRSYCESCKKTLRWFELVPIVSYYSQKGKCRQCDSPLSLQYPLVELLTGVLFLSFTMVVFSRYFQSEESFLTPLFFLFLSFGFVVLIFLMAIFVYDLKHKIIPNTFSYPFALIAFLGMLFQIFVLSGTIFEVTHPAWRLFAGPVLAAPFAALWFFSKGRWMGLGDAKLALGIGWLLGLSVGFTSIIVGFWVGALVGVGLMLVQFFCGKAQLRGERNELTMKSELPLGPFLLFGLVLTLLFEFNLFSGNFFAYGFYGF